MKRRLLLLATCIILAITLNAQTLYVPNGTSGIGTSTTGNIGIGKTNPQQKLEVEGNIKINDDNTYLGAIFQTNTYSTMTFRSRAWQSVQGPNGKAFSFLAHDNNGETSGLEMMAIYYGESGKMLLMPNGGNVLIGKTTQNNTSYKLDVAGKIRANEIIVNTTGADFVFETKYKLPSLLEVEAFIKANKHLPDIPSATDMQTNGMSMGEMQTKLLQKVEELTLYLIELKKENEQLKKDNKSLNKRIEKFEKHLNN